MLILRIKTRDPLRVIRKYESRRARLLAVTSGDLNYLMLYVMDEYDELY
jgi:hypothetical protein